MRFPRLDWIDRDGKLLILAGCVIPAVPATFNPVDIESSALQTALVFFARGVGGLSLIILVVVFAEKVGRRRLLVVLTLMSAAAAVAFVLPSNLWIIMPFIFLGAVGGGSIGQALWQAGIADTAPPHRRTDLYAVYHIAVEVTSFLVLLVVVPAAFLVVLFDLSGILEDTPLVIASVPLLLAAAFLYSRVSPAVEAPAEARKPVNPFKLPSRRVIFTLSGLLGLNTLAANLLYHSVDFYSSISWSEDGSLGKPITFLTSLSLSAIFSIPALWLVAKIANRFGLVKILALTQMAAPLFIIPLAFLPAGGLSVMFWTLYFVLRRMSALLRVSYTMGVVAPEERVATAAIIILVMVPLGVVTPVFGALFADIDQVVIPLVFGGLLAIVSSLALYFKFRNVKPPEEIEKEASDTP